jgi:hypothetical protein
MRPMTFGAVLSWIPWRVRCALRSDGVVAPDWLDRGLVVVGSRSGSSSSSGGGVELEFVFTTSHRPERQFANAAAFAQLFMERQGIFHPLSASTAKETTSSSARTAQSLLMLRKLSLKRGPATQRCEGRIRSATFRLSLTARNNPFNNQATKSQKDSYTGRLQP